MRFYKQHKAEIWFKITVQVSKGVKRKMNIANETLAE